ncbi:MFS transporter [Cronobacter dublinensis]|uniref:MFS transporter n=1 Tax=Cronobacter dublinensis TaxID=413497 RepID=UPI000CFE9883|nr:MFS transporter [Cronobacter dublinensis]EGT5661941.1 MFS transporter [Cronobacter dublinensis subsp. dublinensis]EGT5668791.1 MFS transporter [Cronobacter dublinensis subsp. dublinensis]EGT5673424.1 MFS transporter [Cronobacter dublinensis subsp. dublinensis]EGT5678069.1 MFS transporter [Cronobacter dublinensis subsp. dublinensis]EGT5685669.1 MFS transporter [Cronobacter dublinensis subsp. dublinensis]
MPTYTRPVLLLLCGLLLLTLAIAVLNTLVPLWLAHDNLPTWQVGMVGSSYFTGNLLGTLITGSLIKRFGFNRSYYIASLIFAAGCAGLGVTLGFWSWLAWRFIAGVGCAMIWVVVESALMCSGTSRNRGRLLAAYMMVYYMGTVAGQLMISKLPTDLMSVLPWVTGMIMAAILPLLFTRIVNSSSEHQEKTHVWPMFKLRQARLGVNGCIISGIVLGSLYGLMPLYLNHQGVSDSGIGFWMAVMVSAGIIGQWPIGKLADRFGRLLVLRVQVFVVIVGCMAMLTQAAMAPALFVLGAAGFTLYPVAMAWACEKVEHHQLVAMNQALLLSYTIGSLLGPTFTAMLMQSYSDSLLFVMIASVSFVYLMMLMRKAGHHPTPVAHA